MSRLTPIRPPARRLFLARAGATILLFTPAVLLAGSAAGANIIGQWYCLGIAGLETWAVLALAIRLGVRRATGSRCVLGLYAATHFVLLYGGFDQATPAVQFALAITLLVPVVLFAFRELVETTGPVRKAKFLVEKLLARDAWPTNPAEFRGIPQVRALRAAVLEDAGPVLPLLEHADRNIRLAALAALEFQPVWRKGQAEVVIHFANVSEDPSARAAAAVALANATKARHLAGLVPFLCDASAEVRQAAGIAVLWDAARRWPEVRASVRLALSDPNAARDGPLPWSGAFPQAALDDLVVWSSEAAPVGPRATKTLIRHCRKAIEEDGSPAAIGRITAMLSNPKVPAAIRVELAHRLRAADEFAPEIAAKFIGPANPTMLRLMAAGSLLGQREDARAVDVLREAARQPNREIALAAAGMIQKYLGVDVGLPVGGTLPAANSREAAEVTRRVLQWAAAGGTLESEIETPIDHVRKSSGHLPRGDYASASPL